MAYHDLIDYYIVTATATTRAIREWHSFPARNDEDAERQLENERARARGLILILTKTKPPLHPESSRMAYSETYARSERNMYIWPDGTIGSHFHNVYIPRVRGLVEQVRNQLDMEPIALLNHSDGATYGVESASYEHWAGLRYLSHRYRNDPEYDFRKVLLRKVELANSIPEGLYEVESAEELNDIIDRRADRHNALHNARHVVDEEFTPLVDALVRAYDSAPVGSYDDAAFTNARAALNAYQIITRMRTEAAPERQTPTPLTLDGAKRQAMRTLENTAAQRLSVLTGQPYSWLTLLAVTTYDTSSLTNIVVAAQAAINAVDSRNAIPALVGHWVDRINGWLIPITMTVTHDTRPGRKVNLTVQVTDSATVRMQMLTNKGSGSRQDGYDKLSDSLYTSYPNNQAERGTHFEFTGRGVQTVTFNISLDESLPADTVYSARLTLNVGEPDTPAILTRYYDMGILPPDAD